MGHEEHPSAVRGNALEVHVESAVAARGAGRDPGCRPGGALVDVVRVVRVARLERLEGQEEHSRAVCGGPEEGRAVRAVAARRAGRDPGRRPAVALVDVAGGVRVARHQLLAGVEEHPHAVRGCAREGGVEGAVAAPGAGRNPGGRSPGALVDVQLGVRVARLERLGGLKEHTRGVRRGTPVCRVEGAVAAGRSGRDATRGRTGAFIHVPTWPRFGVGEWGVGGIDAGVRVACLERHVGLEEDTRAVRGGTLEGRAVEGSAAAAFGSTCRDSLGRGVVGAPNRCEHEQRDRYSHGRCTLDEQHSPHTSLPVTWSPRLTE